MSQRGRRGNGVSLCCCSCDFLALSLLPRGCDRGGRGEQGRLGVLPREEVDVENRRRRRGRVRGRRRRRRRSRSRRGGGDEERARPTLLQRRLRPSSSSSSSFSSSPLKLLAQLRGPPLDVTRRVEDEEALEARLGAPVRFFFRVEVEKKKKKVPQNYPLSVSLSSLSLSLNNSHHSRTSATRSRGSSASSASARITAASVAGLGGGLPRGCCFFVLGAVDVDVVDVVDDNTERDFRAATAALHRRWSSAGLGSSDKSTVSACTKIESIQIEPRRSGLAAGTIAKASSIRSRAAHRSLRAPLLSLSSTSAAACTTDRNARRRRSSRS